MANLIAQVPFFDSNQVVAATQSIDVTHSISDAYLRLYDPANPPRKHRSRAPKNSGAEFIVTMPYVNPRGDVYFEKNIFISENRSPGVVGYISVHDIRNNQPIALMDATALTGIRTAAKSLLFSQLYFGKLQREPRAIFIYGSSTQAYYHAIQFSSFYPNATIYLITRSNDSKERISAQLNPQCRNCVVVADQVLIIENPDVIITTTASQHPIVTSNNIGTATLIIAVGSSNGDISEIEPQIVVNSNRYIDALVSIDGKGEYNLPLRMGLFDRSTITELHDVLAQGSSYLFTGNVPTLFVSKGLIIEDYALVMRLLGRDLGE